MGESKKNTPKIKKQKEYKVDTYGGSVQVEWENDGAVTALGQLPFFVQFLKTGNLYDPWVNDCPLSYTSSNAPSKRDVNGTVLLSVLSGHRRYAHIKGEKHLEAITSRPLLLNGIGKLTRHGGQKHISITSTHGKVAELKAAIERLMSIFDYIKLNAEQLNEYQRWCYLLSKAFEKFLKGKQLWSPHLLPA